jgi:integrase
MAVNPHLRLVAPTTEKQTVDMDRRRPNAELRSREHLTPDEVEHLIAAAKDGRWGHRDATMLLVAYRHGLRASELTDLRWDQVDFTTANLHVRRAKKGTHRAGCSEAHRVRCLRQTFLAT